MTSRVVKYPTIFDGRDAVIDLKPEVVVCAVTELRRYSLLNSPVGLKGLPDVGHHARGHYLGCIRQVAPPARDPLRRRRLALESGVHRRLDVELTCARQHDRRCGDLPCCLERSTFRSRSGPRGRVSRLDQPATPIADSLRGTSVGRSLTECAAVGVGGRVARKGGRRPAGPRTGPTPGPSHGRANHQEHPRTMPR